MPPSPAHPQRSPEDVPHGTVLETDEDIRKVSGPQKTGAPATSGPVHAEKLPSEEPARPFRPTARPPVALLTVLDDGKIEGEVIRIRTERFIIGRTEGDFLLPHDMQVSARHLEITRYKFGEKYRWVVTDLQTSNGLFIRVSRTILPDQAEFLVGGGRYRLDAARPDALKTMDSVAPAATRPPAADPLALAQPALVELTGDKILSRFPLTASEYWIGRDPACAICRPNDPFVEARHVRLHRDANGAWHARNNESPNGLWYRVPQITLENACLFQIGEQRFRLRVGG